MSFSGEVLNVDETIVNCNFMEPTKITGSVIRNLWRWLSSSKSKNQTIQKSSVIPINACLEVSKFSSQRMTVFEIIKSDIVETFI